MEESEEIVIEPLPLTEAQIAELDRRIADYLAHPQDVVPWEVARRESLDRLRRRKQP